GPVCIPALTYALKSNDSDVQRNASITLGNFGPAAKAAVPSLVEVLAKSEGYHAAEALGKIGPDAKAAIPALLASCSKPFYEAGDTGGAARNALYRIVSGSKESLPLFLAALGDKEND